MADKKKKKQRKGLHRGFDSFDSENTADVSSIVEKIAGRDSIADEPPPVQTAEAAPAAAEAPKSEPPAPAPEPPPVRKPYEKLDELLGASEGLVKYFGGFLKDRDCHIRAAALRAIADVGPDKVAPFAVEALNDEHPLVRRQALDSLRGWTDLPGVRESIGRLQSDSDDLVRSRAEALMREPAAAVA
ncbi:MAG: hypothetical protein GMKNLPBB_02934 [Myxococcota bacterium]|nr:hypothetical protein [Myxococcota bacterium]